MKIKLSIFMIVMTSITGSLRHQLYNQWVEMGGTSEGKKWEGSWEQSFDMFLINSIVLGGVYLIFLMFDLIDFC